MALSIRLLIVRLAGVLMAVLAIAAALLPLGELPDRVVIGGLLLAAGVVELVAVVARPGRNICAAIAAVASVVAGLRLVLDPGANFFTVFNLVILWLVVRAAALALAARGSFKPLCNWIWLAAAVDFLLALMLLAGLPTTVLIIGVFGPTPEVIATFAWIFAASFIAMAALLFAAATLERERADQASG